LTARLDHLLDAASIAGLLALGSSVIDGRPIALLDADGRLLGGRLPPSADARRQPIELDGGVIGSVVADTASPAALVALMARSVELIAGGTQHLAAQVRIDHELAIGRRIQFALLPQRFPSVAGWSFAATYEPAREVGGDFYDLFTVRGQANRLAFIVADVTGKGIPAALLMADVRALLHAAVDNADGPADALARVNRILIRERPTSLFVTASLLVADAATGAIRYASAGHEPPIVVRRAGGHELLEAQGALLGAFEDGTFEERETHLGPGDLLVTYTDGVTDARDVAGSFFGEERFLEVVMTPGRAPAEVTHAVGAALAEFRAGAEAFDDVTLVVARRD